MQAANQLVDGANKMLKQSSSHGKLPNITYVNAARFIIAGNGS